MASNEKPVPVSQAAKTVGRSHTALQIAIQKGRLTKCVVRSKSGKPKILLSLFKAEWDAFTDPVAAEDGRRGGRPSKKAKTAPASPPTVLRVAPAFQDRVPDHSPAESDTKVYYDENGQALLGLQASRLKEEHFKAQMAEVKFREKAGELVDAKAAREAAFKLGRQLREALLSIPERMSSRLAAETDPHKVHRVLLDEITKSLMSLPSAAPADAG